MQHDSSSLFTPEDLWALPRVGLPVCQPGGRWLVYGTTIHPELTAEERERERPASRQQLHCQDLRTGQSRPLTDPELHSSEPAIAPDESRLAFVRKGPDQAHGQLYLMPIDGGEARRVTDMPLGVQDPRWMPDGKGILFLTRVFLEALDIESTRRLVEDRKKLPPQPRVTEDRLYRFWDRWLTDGEVHHIFLLDLESGGIRDLTPDSTRWFDFMDPSGAYDVSPDGAEVCFSANSSRPPHDRVRWALFAVPVAGGAVSCLTPDNPAGDRRPRYTPDGRYLLYGMQREWDFYADRVRLVLHDRRGGTSRTLTEEWDRSAGEWIPTLDSKSIFLTAENLGRTSIYRIPTAGGQPEIIATGGTITGLCLGGDKRLHFNHMSLREAPEIARTSTRGGAIERVTGHTHPVMAEKQLGEVVECEIAGADGDPVQLFVIRPPGHDSTRRHPLVHLIHGGPHGMFGDAFSFRWNPQVLAARGYLIAMVNFHGSVSYGQEFASGIQGAWGEKPPIDIEAATDYLIDVGAVDSERMAITGGSYGGYLTAYIASQTDRYRCGICHAGVVNFSSMYAGDITQGRARALGGEPWRDRVQMERWSPSSEASGMNTPMLVIHGERDYRVPVSQGLELYGILKAKGLDARLVYYPDENHWILRRENSIHWYGEFLAWIGRFLGAD